MLLPYACMAFEFYRGIFVILLHHWFPCPILEMQILWYEGVLDSMMIMNVGKKKTRGSKIPSEIKGKKGRSSWKEIWKHPC